MMDRHAKEGNNSLSTPLVQDYTEYEHFINGGSEPSQAVCCSSCQKKSLSDNRLMCRNSLSTCKICENEIVVHAQDKSCKRCCKCTENSLTFYEKLEIPLVFTLYTDFSCYNGYHKSSDTDDVSLSELSITDFTESIDEGIFTPEDDISLEECEDHDTHCTYTSTMIEMDSNHNETKVTQSASSSAPIPCKTKHCPPTIHIIPSTPPSFYTSRLSTVQESVSEDILEDSPDYSVDTMVGEYDPFVRRYDSIVNRSSGIDQIPWTHSSDNLTDSLSDHIVSPLLQRRNMNKMTVITSSVTSEETSHMTSESTSSVKCSQGQRRRTRRTGTCLDIEEVKELTSRLNLQTRRPSVHAWKNKHFCGENPKLMISDKETSHQGDENGVRWSRDFKNKIDSSLDWLKNELISMREQDAILARKLLNIRKDMYKLKLQKSTLRHQLILEEAIEIEEEREELQQISDTTPPDLFSPTLKQYGVTRMNLHSRRFSVF